MRLQVLGAFVFILAVPVWSQVTVAKPMAKDAHPGFDVATVKPHDPASNHQGFDVSGERVTIRQQSLLTLIMFAYSVHPKQIVGLPEWGRETWDVEGTTDVPGEPSLRQQQEMLRKLLTERFGLTFHREKQELSVYAMQVAKGGPKLKPAAKPDAESEQDASGHGDEVTVKYVSADMQDFILYEGFFLDRPLVDQTGLKGKYDFSLRYTFNESKATEDPNAAPGLFTAVQEQLGLKFLAVKAPVEVLVVEKAERPAAN